MYSLHVTNPNLLGTLGQCSAQEPTPVGSSLALVIIGMMRAIWKQEPWRKPTWTWGGCANPMQKECKVIFTLFPDPFHSRRDTGVAHNTNVELSTVLWTRIDTTTKVNIHWPDYAWCCCDGHKSLKWQEQEVNAPWYWGSMKGVKSNESFADLVVQVHLDADGLIWAASSRCSCDGLPSIATNYTSDRSPQGGSQKVMCENTSGNSRCRWSPQRTFSSSFSPLLGVESMWGLHCVTERLERKRKNRLY